MAASDRETVMNRAGAELQLPLGHDLALDHLAGDTEAEPRVEKPSRA